MMLESIYGQSFSDSPHGFRPNKSRQTAPLQASTGLLRAALRRAPAVSAAMHQSARSGGALAANHSSR
ncbi:MAG: hypothetical protein LBU32_28770 [Clostridiales bacterium]|nr:hypothetical protein [Clostridiales bacterium]